MISCLTTAAGKGISFGMFLVALDSDSSVGVQGSSLTSDSKGSLK